MEAYKKQFIDFLIDNGALRFGEFTLRSGRISPYFINTGEFRKVSAVYGLGRFYAAKIRDQFKPDEYDVIFGPAYKGISLSLATGIALLNDFGIDKECSYDRKEAKDHGDAKAFVGAVPESGRKWLVLDDVFTTGETKEEAVKKIIAVAKVEYPAVVIAVDRMEMGEDGTSAIREFEKKYRIPVHAIVTVREIIDCLSDDRKISGFSTVHKPKMEAYLTLYGVK
ncbi:orotate phosphoribosyltransferase [Candidatus Woesearchaeota archaeon]|nr:orotate phosphoribosyltransferase [Candidatus Woesearchaeota archaeon]